MIPLDGYQKISDRKFLDILIAFTPYKCVEGKNGVAAFCGEAFDIRPCRIIGKMEKTRSAIFQFGDEHYKYHTPVTMAEFERLCAAVIPDNKRSPGETTWRSGENT